MFLNVGNIFPVNMALKMEKILHNWENLVAELRAEDGSKSPLCLDSIRPLAPDWLEQG